MTVIHAEEVAGLGIAAIIARARQVVGDGPTYLTFDIDSLDPAFAPGTGTPEVGGLTTREALALLRGLKGLNLVGGDVVEVAPQYDATTNTAHAGAQMLFEILSLMVFSPSRWRTGRAKQRRPMERRVAGSATRTKGERNDGTIQCKHVSRRAVLGAGAAGAACSPCRPSLRAQDRSLKVGVYGGYFKDSLRQEHLPRFHQGDRHRRRIGRRADRRGLAGAARAGRQGGQAPADVSMMSQVSTLKGQDDRALDAARHGEDPELRQPARADFVNKVSRTAASPASAPWPGTSRSSPTPTSIKEPPTSWAALWDPANEDKLGLLALVSNSFLLEVTAKTFFGGTDALDTEEGILKVFDKLAEVKPNVRLWYRDEAQFEQALKSGEIPMGQYYHDVTGLAAADGQPVRSTFPKEGGVQDSGSWVLSRPPRRSRRRMSSSTI